jgi:hypothetical protein
LDVAPSRSTWRHIPEDSILQSPGRDSLKSRIKDDTVKFVCEFYDD